MINGTTITVIQGLRKEAYFGEDTPLVPNDPVMAYGRNGNMEKAALVMF